MATRVSTNDFSKKPLKGASHDNRDGGADIGLLFNFAPYESGYCFLTVMGTPKIMRKGYGFEAYDNRDVLLASFVDILEREFIGLSGIGDSNLSSNELSNNIVNVPVMVKNEKDSYSTIDMTFTEKSGLPITKFLDMYTRYVYDPYTQLKHYGGRRRTDAGAKSNSKIESFSKMVKNVIDNESFTLLYVITDNTGILVEKAYILHNAIPTNVSWSTISNNTRFEVEKKEITINWSCQVLDGPIPNRIGSKYVRDLYDRVISKSDTISLNSERYEERDWHITLSDSTASNNILSIRELGNYYAVTGNKNTPQTLNSIKNKVK